ncbi:winged helix-turn-helix domain-containing protein [uncultured Psychroserpens sp.]|uniref:winged helix-turn-helix domain-containing protein n=1 Tax=uncultured Psychroserpens sp. TaxID=255436 RepID=UPI002620D315|nr:winged helix-turn-helix domain-containing protein [uncultured Psychroserpens sp.]
MNRICNPLLVTLSVILWLSFITSCLDKKNEVPTERVKIALRDAGNQLLLSNKDSTSLILPVVVLEVSKYRLSLDNDLSFDPSNLVEVIQQSFNKASLTENYRVEVIQCSDEEVAYSYKMSASEEQTIIPCAGRLLPNNCYFIEVYFTDITVPFYKSNVIWIGLLGITLLMIFMMYYHKRSSTSNRKPNKNYAAIGSFRFYPEKHKLVKSAQEISLSKKECELLEIFYEHLNDVVKREELERRVWEDNGVFVGRSLDTYISKLRKKFNDDPSIKITNVHGVGYKLEVIKE